jgi:hypothetical protein
MTGIEPAATVTVRSKRKPTSKRLNPGLDLRRAGRHQEEMTTKHVHEWAVYSTAILGRCLLLQCVKCGALGTVDDPTTREWARAFRAPSRPYRWADEARVHVRCEPPCPFFVIRAEEGAPACPCPPRPGAQGRREYERFPGEILTPGEALTGEEKEELEQLAGVGRVPAAACNRVAAPDNTPHPSGRPALPFGKTR